MNMNYILLNIEEMFRNKRSVARGKLLKLSEIHCLISVFILVMDGLKEFRKKFQNSTYFFINARRMSGSST